MKILGATLSVLANGPGVVGAGNFNFSVNYLGVKTGVLKVTANAGDAQQDKLSLHASLLGLPAIAFLRRGQGDTAIDPGDLALFGGPGNNEMEMFLSGPGSLTGDIYGGAPFFEPVEPVRAGRGWGIVFACGFAPAPAPRSFPLPSPPGNEPGKRTFSPQVPAGVAVVG
jgi:hypothetical protein